MTLYSNRGSIASWPCAASAMQSNHRAADDNLQNLMALPHTRLERRQHMALGRLSRQANIIDTDSSKRLAATLLCHAPSIGRKWNCSARIKAKSFMLLFVLDADAGEVTTFGRQ